MTICSKCGLEGMYDLRIRAYEQSRFGTELEVEGKFCIGCAMFTLANFSEKLNAYNDAAVERSKSDKAARAAAKEIAKKT